MPPLAEPAECPTRHVGLLRIHGGQADSCAFNEQVEIANTLGAEARLDDY